MQDLDQDTDPDPAKSSGSDMFLIQIHNTASIPPFSLYYHNITLILTMTIVPRGLFVTALQ